MPAGRAPAGRLALRAIAAAVAAGFALPAAVLPQATIAAQASVSTVTPRIVARTPHDRAAFTQGLLWRDGHIYESTGQFGRSEVRRVRLADGTVLARRRLPASVFGEGLASWREELISLSWTNGVAYRWRARDLKPLGTRRYTGEGWGLAAHGEDLILSDGSARLRFVDPATFAVRRTLDVTYNGRPLRALNELEVVDGTLLANIWKQPAIVRIDLASGRVTQVIDLTALVAEVAPADPDAVANGIAWDAQRRRLFVTGKLWPTLFEIEI